MTKSDLKAFLIFEAIKNDRVTSTATLLRNEADYFNKEEEITLYV